MIKNNKDKEYWFFDESRFGTHSKIGHAWFKKGTRPRIKVKLGFKNFYLYSAINPKTGESFTLLLPNVNKECMKIFMNEFFKRYQKENRNITIIMDGAGWHLDKEHLLKDTKNIEIILQPPYSPELNPVERLWQYIKNHTIKNKLFETLEELEREICWFVREKLTREIIRNICNKTCPIIL